MLCPPSAPTPVDGRNQSAAPWPPTSDTSGGGETPTRCRAAISAQHREYARKRKGMAV